MMVRDWVSNKRGEHDMNNFGSQCDRAVKHGLDSVGGSNHGLSLSTIQINIICRSGGL